MAMFALRLAAAVPSLARAPLSARTLGLACPTTVGRVAPTSSVNWAAIRLNTGVVDQAPQSLAGWASMNLSAPLLRAVKDTGYAEPTPIQARSIPAVLEGRDVLAGSQTGTGKTAGFVLPILQKLTSQAIPRPRSARALILAPTRELCQQVEQSVRTYGRHTSIRSVAAFGGTSKGPQIRAVQAGVDIIVATPGRLRDLMDTGIVRLDQIQFLVLDEADRMLDMGFEPQIRGIVKDIPETRQTMLFSATYDSDVRHLAMDFLKDPITLDVAERNAAPVTVEQTIIRVDQARKFELLTKLVNEPDVTKALVFCKTKRDADSLGYDLEVKGRIPADSIHGEKNQSQRDQALANFKRGSIKVLVATEVAARGIDIRDISHVFQYELPQNPSDYLHRIGRTGRAGRLGKAISLYSPQEEELLRAVNKTVPYSQRPKEMVMPGFEPDETAARFSSFRGGYRGSRGPTFQQRDSFGGDRGGYGGRAGGGGYSSGGDGFGRREGGYGGFGRSNGGNGSSYGGRDAFYGDGFAPAPRSGGYGGPAAGGYGAPAPRAGGYGGFGAGGYGASAPRAGGAGQSRQSRDSLDDDNDF
eukprot:TRINITY_DN2018_c0_g1_i2.p1 TRINITY_DN2018_c0_g1~~TRINITY_DN2018_c0_g1_i2.p1  ORF type:complete len:585 (-),score=179.31 TRINITY_DN2018_c0_g1_i2:652-2406(-)